MQWQHQLPRNGGTKGGQGSGGGAPRKIFGPRPFYARKCPFYRQGTPVFTAGGTLFKCNSTLRSSKTVKIMGFLMTNFAKIAMSSRYGSNETLVSISHLDMSHQACSRDSSDKEQYEKFLHNVKLQFLMQAIS